MFVRSPEPYRCLCWLLPILVAVACGAPAPPGSSTPGAPAGSVGPSTAGLPTGAVTQEQVMLGRQLVVNHDCGGCHGGTPNPAAPGWLAGSSGEDDADRIGEYRVWPPNLTPDAETGLGLFSERQIFNALRYGLRPGATPDVEITSAVPGQGNHPADPNYLSAGMPWLAWRYMFDTELWAIAAYLKHGLRPVRHEVPAYEAPADFWASEFTVEKIGTDVLPEFPTEHEELRLPERREEVLRGRVLVAASGCGECHGGGLHPAADGWLTGALPAQERWGEFQVGPFKTYPRNLTPDNGTGIGRFSERQIFNALRYGLRPGETPDVEITSTTPGEGNHPLNPKYLAPPMPWPGWRHFSDQELGAIAAYLKHGLKPVRNRVQDSEGPPDFWAGVYTLDRIGPYPAPAFPTANERLLR